MGEILGHQIPGAEAVNEAWKRAFEERLAVLGAGTDAGTPERLARYHAMLCEWNERMNLTGDTDFSVALDRHYMDSLAPLRLEGAFGFGARVIDVGSGAGFPGLPLAIARPDLRVTLLDALGKRVNFLRAVTQALGLENVSVIHARAEDGARDPALRERFDLAVARAVAPLPVLCELLLPFVAVGGRMLCYKGPSATEELAGGARAARLVGGGVPEALAVEVPGRPDWRHVVIACRKEAKTVRQYPRKAGTPGRAPLGAEDKKA